MQINNRNTIENKINEFRKELLVNLKCTNLGHCQMHVEILFQLHVWRRKVIEDGWRIVFLQNGHVAAILHTWNILIAGLNTCVKDSWGTCSAVCMELSDKKIHVLTCFVLFSCSASLQRIIPSL